MGNLYLFFLYFRFLKIFLKCIYIWYSLIVWKTIIYPSISLVTLKIKISFFILGLWFFHMGIKISIFWLMTQIWELCLRVKPGNKFNFIIINKNGDFIAIFLQVMPTNYHTLCILYIHKNIIAYKTNFS